jgi:hypothetical protein
MWLVSYYPIRVASVSTEIFLSREEAEKFYDEFIEEGGRDILISKVVEGRGEFYSNSCDLLQISTSRKEFDRQMQEMSDYYECQEVNKKSRNNFPLLQITQKHTGSIVP